jgi:uncharacterized membrane protein
MCVTLIFLAPILVYFKSKYGFLIYFIFSPLCHQISERSFHIFGFQLAVCSRCTGIYLGLFIGTILYPLIFSIKRQRIPSFKLFILFSFPMGLDVIGNILNLWISSGIIRFLTGFIFGLLLPFYLIPGIMDLAEIKFNFNKNFIKIENENKISNY